MKNPWIIIGALTIVLFGGALWYSSVAGEQNNEGVEILTHIKGNPDGVVTLVKYSDLQCPTCAQFVPVVDGILEEYGDQIRFEYKHFPLPIHSFAQMAALAAEAAGQQGQFYAYHDVLFEKQAEWSRASNPQALFLQYAEDLGLDVALFRRHMNSSVLRDKVRSDATEARTLGITSTPTFFLNGEQMDPDVFRTYDGFVAQVARTVNPEAFEGIPENEIAPAADSGVRFGL